MRLPAAAKLPKALLQAERARYCDLPRQAHQGRVLPDWHEWPALPRRHGEPAVCIRADFERHGRFVSCDADTSRVENSIAPLSLLAFNFVLVGDTNL